MSNFLDSFPEESISGAVRHISLHDAPEIILFHLIIVLLVILFINR